MNKYVYIGGGLVAAYVAYRSYRGAKELITKDLNPVSDENIAYTAFENDEGMPLGTQIYDGVQDFRQWVGLSSEHDLFEGTQ